MVFPKLVDLSDRADNKDISITSEKVSPNVKHETQHIAITMYFKTLLVVFHR